MYLQIIICTLFFLGVVFLDFRKVVKSKQKKTITIYAFCLVTAYLISMLYAFDVPIFSPAVPIKQFIGSVFNIQ